MINSGQAHTEVVTFESGFPDGNVTYTLTGASAPVTGSVTPTVGAVSVNIQITGLENTATLGSVLEGRRLDWTYTVGAVAVAGQRTWLLREALPFPATSDGVRNKLGLDLASDLSDESIDLTGAYLRFRAQVGVSTLAGFETGDAYALLLAADAIEATAALQMVPTMQVRVAKTETSGTNTYTRQDVNWEALVGHLRSYVDDAAAYLSGTTTTFTGSGLFSVATRSDNLFPDG